MKGVFYVATSECMFHDICMILIRALVEYMYCQQIHTSILNLIYVLNDILHVSSCHLAFFREVKYKLLILYW